MGLSEDRSSYQKTIYVSYPECDWHNEWKISYLMRCVQQIASDQLDAMDLNFHKLYQQGMVFLLSREQVILHRAILAGEALTVTTWPVQPKGAQFRRTVSFTDEKGCRAASVYTSWTLVDPVAHKIHRPSAFPYTLTLRELTEPGEQGIANLRAVQAEQTVEGIPLDVRYSNTDCNGHLNNAVYGDLVLDCIPEEVLREQRPCEFFIHYIKEAKIGSRVCTSIGKVENNGWSVAGTVQQESCFEAHLFFTPRPGQKD